MNEIQIYSAVMFFTGVALTQAIFYFDRKRKEKKFYIFLSAVILQILENTNLTHASVIEFSRNVLKTLEESEKQKYLEEESRKLSALMELYVLLFIKAVPPSGRKHISFSSWSEAQALIKQMRGFLQNEKSKRQTLED